MTFQPSSDEAQSLNKNGSRFALVIATFFFAGYIRRAPGTFASLLTTVLWVAPIFMGAPPVLRFCSAVIIFIVGVWASNRALVLFGGQRDPQAIVIDEVAGQTLALAICPPAILPMLVAFALFRFFDILKPGPIGWLDQKVKGGLGVMLDDMAAGLAALIIYAVGHWMWFIFSRS
jgi:phosphatidylglycerophosphatase A